VRRQAAVVLALALAGCAAAAPAAAPAPASRLADPDDEARVSAALEAVVVSDTRPGGADSLFVSGATIIANGSNRISTPRLAGVMYGGRAAVTTSQVNVRQDMAWASIDYRWFSDDRKDVRLGKATLVLAPTRSGASWKVVQMHSSSSR